MIGVFWLLTALLGGDPCSPVVEPPEVEVDPRSMELRIARSYGIPWAVCAQEKGGKPPLLRVTVKDGAGVHSLLEKPLELGQSLREGTRSISETVTPCRDAAPNARDASAVLQGPAGRRRWYNRRMVEVELIAEGPLAPLAFKAQREVYCRACEDGDTVSFSSYVNDFDKNTVRMVVSLDRARFECAQGGGRMMLRRFWSEPGADEWTLLRPYEVVDNLQERLKPVDANTVRYEVIEPMAKFCKQGKAPLVELVGVDEYASIIHHSYGPSDALHRGGIEFLRCE